MQITITTASGDIDEWEGAMDALDDCGALVVIYRLADDDVPEDLKTLTLRTQQDQGPDLPPLDKATEARVAAVYAPGMWVKVEYA